MEKKIKVAFDLDGIFIDKPPLVPKSLLEWLFKGSLSHRLHYRFPRGRGEQLVRKISHFYLFRPPLRQNLCWLKKLSSDENFVFFAVSGRYRFLQKETEIWLEKRGLKPLFKEVFLNLGNEQPHLFKEKVLKEIKADIFVDDDPLLADYLAQKLGTTRIYCYSRKKTGCQKAKPIASLGLILK